MTTDRTTWQGELRAAELRDRLDQITAELRELRREAIEVAESAEAQLTTDAEARRAAPVLRQLWQNALAITTAIGQLDRRP